MAPLVLSPRIIARSLTSDLEYRVPHTSPLHPALRQSQPSTFSLLSLRSTAARLIPRLADNVNTVPEGYGLTPSGPDAGTIVGIVLGSVAGFLLLLWLIYTCVNLGNPGATAAVIETASVGTASVVTRKSRKQRRHRSSHHSHAHTSSPRRETVEVRRTTERRMSVPPPPVERIVVEERSRSRVPMAPPPPRPVPDDDDDDEVVVIEENTPPRRRESRQKRRSSERRSSGYREVDPYRYAGGDETIRSVSRRRSDSRRR